MTGAIQRAGITYNFKHHTARFLLYVDFVVVLYVKFAMLGIVIPVLKLGLVLHNHLLTIIVLLLHSCVVCLCQIKCFMC